MSDTPETIAAILAEMRAAGRSDEHADGPLIEDYADRIEAAAKRERVEIRRDAEIEWTRIGYEERKAEEKSAPSNAAALREALEWVADFSSDDYIDDEYSIDGENLQRAAERARAALSAPARNCDRFKTLDEAREAFQDLRGHKILADVELWDSMDEAGALVRWLFAPAQGGAKCVNGLRGEPDCRGCNEHCEDVRKRNCFYWNPDIEGGVCALTGKKSCPISCDNFHIPEEVSPPPAEGGDHA